MKRIGIEIGLEAGDFFSTASRLKGSISSIEEAMKKAHDQGNLDLYGKLAFQKERMMGNQAKVDNNIKSFARNEKLQGLGEHGQPIFKFGHEANSAFRDLTKAMKELAAKHQEQINHNDFTGADKTFAELEQKQRAFNKLSENVNNPVGRGANGALNTLAMREISSAINSGFNLWAGAQDRSGIVSQYGSGDIMGARISEMRRQNAISSGAVGITSGLANGLNWLGPWGIAANAAIQLGGGIFNAVNEGRTNREATNAAHAELWQQQSGDAMELAALRGSPNNIREAFKSSADASAAFGYSAEEGMEAMKEAARQGLNISAAEILSRQVFQYERSTGADRGTMRSLAAMSARYGGGDALRSGWAGLHASGMQTGQYSEYLRGLQRVMEDGISKGFIRSSDQVARNLTMLSMMTDNDSLWQGENGVRRLTEINSGLENATGLQDSSQTIAFKAAMKIARETNQNATWGDAMELMENPGNRFRDLFVEIDKQFREVEGSGNTMGVVEHYRNLFGWNYTTARMVESQMANGMMPSDQVVRSGMSMVSNIPNASSSELDFARATQELRNIWTQEGQVFFDGKLNEILAELRNARNPPETREDRGNNTGGGGNVGSSRNSEYGGRVYGNNTYRTALLDKMFDPDENRYKNRVDEIISMSLALGNPDAAGREKGRQVTTWLQELPNITAEQMNRENTLNNIRDISQLHTLLERLINETSSVRDAVNNSSLEVNY